MKTHHIAVKGFTLIELMVTVAIAAVLLMTAIPSVTSFARNAELTSFANTMLSAMNAARGEAMKRGRYAMVVPSDGVNWNSGWIVFVDTYPAIPNKAYDAGVGRDILVVSQGAIPSYLSISPSPNSAVSESPPYIMYDASGYSTTKTAGFGANTLQIQRNDVTGAELLSRTRRLIIASTGRAKICTPTSDTDINCGSDATN